MPGPILPILMANLIKRLLKRRGKTPPGKKTLEGRVGPIHLYTGDAAGKTSAALGRALRAVGHGHRVIIVQFLKGRTDIGEYKIAERLSPEYEIHQYGTEEFIDMHNPSEEDVGCANEGLEAVRKAVETGPDVLVLDEICYACAYRLVKTEDVVDILEHKPERMYIILTGRQAPQELIDLADIATELTDLKGRDCTAREGVEY